MQKSRYAPYYLFLICIVAVNFAGIRTGFFSDDPALYASIAKQFLYQHSFFELYSYGEHWLDKPHFPFWMAMFSFRIFGISVWAYKLPALLFFVMSLFYTYFFTKKYYGREAGFTAVLITGSALHVLMSNTDVRAEPYLMGLIIGTIYHISEMNGRFRWYHLVLAAFYTACAIMTKGLFVMVAIYGALFGQLFFQKRLRELLRWKWLVLFLLTIMFITPELYALYTQFDLHPERVVFYRQNVSGIRFFLWDSQFGRFINNGPIKRKGGSIFFFVHTLSWAFAPWCMLFFYVVYSTIKDMVRGIGMKEYYSFSGSILLLILFSLSGFQLPFYTNILFPLFAVFMSRIIYEREGFSRPARLYYTITQLIYIAGFTIVVLALFFLLSPDSFTWMLISILIVAALCIVVFLWVKQASKRLFFLSCVAMIFVQFFLVGYLYPEMVRYKGEIRAAEYVNEHIPADTPVYIFRSENNAFQFYCNRPVAFAKADTRLKKNLIYFADDFDVDALNKQQVPFTVIGAFADYGRETINLKFLNRKTRDQALTSVYLIRL
ncbi:MAG: glycosyltransferase family 39 protein [Mucilaginibacter polytrichastri]|nr:glycosyltransferase family 39 protein [Mucilaginibacter polytrichastri]